LTAFRLRIVSYNIQVLSQGADGVMGTLARLAPDLIGLQEVDHGTLRSRGADQAKQLADALGPFLST
jgi:endonuclease/exonuclease/phosphatase family metal-dependent hydrolase